MEHLRLANVPNLKLEGNLEKQHTPTTRENAQEALRGFVKVHEWLKQIMEILGLLIPTLDEIITCCRHFESNELVYLPKTTKTLSLVYQISCHTKELQDTLDSLQGLDRHCRRFRVDVSKDVTIFAFSSFPARYTFCKRRGIGFRHCFQTRNILLTLFPVTIRHRFAEWSHHRYPVPGCYICKYRIDSPSCEPRH